MQNYKSELQDLNFHDSTILSINISNDEHFDRTTTLIIEYYNWEGNSEESESWKYKLLKITFHHMVHNHRMCRQRTEGNKACNK